MIKISSPYSIATFRIDVTPPLQHALLGGLVLPALVHDDALEAIGYVILGPEAPLVVCVLDWAGLLNEAHVRWRTTLAAAAGTTPERVAVQCVHQHNAPFVCPEANAAVARHTDLPAMFDPAFFESCLARAHDAVRHAVQRPRPITHVACGHAMVREVASNRRVARSPDGRVCDMRKSSCEDPALRALPEGTIDPTLQTVAFFHHDEKVVACHYYATHPMSYYRDGRVSSDFCGLARKRRQQDEPGCTHLYFTGCAGNVAAGKYNDGSHAARGMLTQRIYDSILAAEAALPRPEPLQRIAWRTELILPPPPTAPTAAVVERELGRSDLPPVERLLHAFRLGWLRRVERRVPIVLSCLRLNEASILHLPGEMFVEYQLRARAMRPAHPVACAAYGDDGLWYVPPREEYPHGGYEVEHAFSADRVDEIVTSAIARLLA